MILVAGSANLDFVVRAEHIPLPGETVLGREFATYPGGKGANQAVASARAGGATTHLLCAMGDDPYSVPLKASLREAEVAMHVIRSQKFPTGCAFICVSDDAENAITVAPGANLTLAAEHLFPLEGFTHLLMQLEIPIETVLAYAKQARAQGLQVVLNAAPARVLPSTLLELVDILVVNEGELATLSRHPGDLASCAAQIPVPTVIVTLGARGCQAFVDGTSHTQAPFKVQAVDTTGAGDTFCGALVAKLSQGEQIPAAMRYASAAAALACTRPGAQSSIPHSADVEQLLATSS